MLSTKGMRFPIDVILVCIRWYAAYPLSYRHLEEMMQERGVFVDHSSINRWAIRFLPLLENVFRKYKRPAGGISNYWRSFRNTHWTCWRKFRVAAKATRLPLGVQVLSEALNFTKCPIFGGWAHLANNIIEQDHRAVKRITNPMLGFKSFWCAQKLIAGIETMHMVKKGQLHCPNGLPMSAADQFYSLAV